MYNAPKRVIGKGGACEIAEEHHDSVGCGTLVSVMGLVGWLLWGQ